MKNQKMIEKLLMLMVAAFGLQCFNFSSLLCAKTKKGPEIPRRFATTQVPVAPATFPHSQFLIFSMPEEFAGQERVGSVQVVGPEIEDQEYLLNQRSVHVRNPVYPTTNISGLPDEIIGTILSNMSKFEDINNILAISYRFKEKEDFLKRFVINLDLSNNTLMLYCQLDYIVRSFPNLRNLNLSGSTLIIDADLAHLARLVKLQNLNLENCSQITDVGLAHLAELINLEYLNLKECKLITDVGLAHLSGLVNLQSLNLRGCDKITDAGIERYLRPLIDRGLRIIR